MPVYSLEYLPPMDFPGYNIGPNLIEKKGFNFTKLIKRQKTKFSRYLVIILIYLGLPVVFCHHKQINR